MAVIKYSIEKNLSIAIANYNNYTGVKANFQMPKLKEDEWDKIYSNISIISFLQGLNIGGKVYNGYSIINNTKNDEYVSENSIYIADKSSKNEELKDASEDVKTQNKFAEATFGIHTGNGVVVNKLNFNGNEYSFSDLATKTSAQIGNIIIYYSGNQNGSSEKKGYYRFISNVATQGNFYLNYTSSWEYLGESYLVGGPDEGRYYQITDLNISGENIMGVLNTDFERRSYTDNNGTTKYFYPKKQFGSYSSIVNQSSSVVDTIDAINDKNIYQYLDSNGNSIRTAYYTALGRERYSMYRTNNIIQNTESKEDDDDNKKDEEEPIEETYEFAEEVKFSGTKGNETVYVSTLIKREGQSINLFTSPASKVGNIVIYYPGTYNSYPYIYLKTGYYKYIAKSQGSGNSMLNNTSAWEYIGEDISIKIDNVQFQDAGNSGAYIGSFSYNGKTYTSMSSLTISEIGNIIVYYPGTYNNYNKIYTKPGYYKYIATETSSGNPFLNTTSSWMYLGDSIDD